MNLDAMSMDELKKLRKDVDRAIANYETRRKAEATALLEEKARELGFSLNDLVSTAPKRGKKPSVVRYRHPENPTLGWSGRGRRPAWINEAIAAGKSLEDLAV